MAFLKNINFIKFLQIAKKELPYGCFLGFIKEKYKDQRVVEKGHSGQNVVRVNYSVYTLPRLSEINEKNKSIFDKFQLESNNGTT